MREIFDRIRVPLHQKREISELEQMREISGPCKSILPTHALLTGSRAAVLTRGTTSVRPASRACLGTVPRPGVRTPLRTQGGRSTSN